MHRGVCAFVITHFVHSHLFEGHLQKLEVMDVFVLQLGAKFDFLQRHRVGEQHVHELAVDGTWTRAEQKINTNLHSRQRCVDIDTFRRGYCLCFLNNMNTTLTPE